MKLISKSALLLCFAAVFSAAAAHGAPSSDVFVVRTKTPTHRAHTRIAHGEKALYGYLENAASRVRQYGPVGITIYARDNTEKVKAIVGWAEQYSVTPSVVETARIPAGRVEIAVYPSNEDAAYPHAYDWASYEYNENDPDPEVGAYGRNALRAMLSNRRDLVRGRGTTLSDGERAAQIVSQYRAYKPSSGEKASDQPVTSKASDSGLRSLKSDN